MYIRILLLLISLSADTFLTGLSVGITGIRLHFWQFAVINLTNVFFLCSGFLFGKLLTRLIPMMFFSVLSALVLFLLGLSRLPRKSPRKHINITNRPKIPPALTLLPLLGLAVTLSTDSLAAGCTIAAPYALLPLILFTAIMTEGVAIFCGIMLGHGVVCGIGRRTGSLRTEYFRTAGGIVLMMLAVFKLIRIFH